MKKDFFEDVRGAFVTVRAFYSPVPSAVTQEACARALDFLLSARSRIVSGVAGRERYVLLYAIDTLFEVRKTGNAEMIFDYADAAHNLPELGMKTRTLESYAFELGLFRKKYGKGYFPFVKNAEEFIYPSPKPAKVKREGFFARVLASEGFLFFALVFVLLLGVVLSFFESRVPHALFMLALALAAVALTRKSLPLHTVIVSCLAALLFPAFPFAMGAPLLLFCVSLALFALCLYIGALLFRRVPCFALLGEAAFLLIELWVLSRQYSFVGGRENAFLLPAIVGGVLFAVIGVLFWFLRSPLPKRKSALTVGAVFLFAFLVLLLCATLSHLNYALDGAPRAQNVTVIDKTHRNDLRLPDEYAFTVRVADGTTCEIRVPRDAYGRYGVGDTLPVSRFDGALGEPFYLYSETRGNAHGQ